MRNERKGNGRKVRVRLVLEEVRHQQRQRKKAVAGANLPLSSQPTGQPSQTIEISSQLLRVSD